MFAALATLVFLATLWLIAAVAQHILVESGTKIIAALRGESLLANSPATRPVAVRYTQRSRPAPVMRAEARWRAAA